MKPNPVPSLEEMYRAIDLHLAIAARYKHWRHINDLLDQRLRIPELHKFLSQMGARGA